MSTNDQWPKLERRGSLSVPQLLGEDLLEEGKKIELIWKEIIVIKEFEGYSGLYP